MSLVKRGKTWHCHFVVNGQRFRQSLETKDWREAQSKEKQLIAEASEGKLTQNSTTLARLPFTQAADDYVSARKLELAPASQAKEKQLLVQLRAYFKQEPLKALTVKRITDYRAWRAEQTVGPATLNAELGILRRILKRAKLWARVADDIRPLKEPRSIGRAITEVEKQRLLKTAVIRPEWETAYLAAILCLNTTARGCELKGLQWYDVDLFARTLSIRTSKTAAGERVVPLTDVATSALARLRRRAEGFGTVEPSHYVFAAFVPKFTFSGKRVVDYNVTGFDPARHVKSWRTAWRTLTKKAGLPGFRFHDLRHCAITQLAENGTSDSTIMAIAGHVSRRMLERYSHVRMEAKRNAMEALAVSTKTAGYDTNHDTNAVAERTRPV
ncbi:MAG TPA: tyrosine-type recombinase/integrase [Terriglobales bacterium]|nr:tyrosine-type recombinase/integrase [Terriglobales bacterium]